MRRYFCFAAGILAAASAAVMPATAVAQWSDFLDDAARSAQRLLKDTEKATENTAKAVRRATDKAGSETARRLAVRPLNALVVNVQGQVHYQPAGTTIWRPLKRGDRLRDGDKIKTGLRSNAVVQVGGTQVYVKPLSSVTITKFLEIPDEARPVDRGGLSVRIQKDRPRIDMRPAPATKHSVPGG